MVDIEVKTKFNPEEIHQEIEYNLGKERKFLSTSIIRLSDEGVVAALLALGWVPPKKNQIELTYDQLIWLGHKIKSLDTPLHNGQTCNIILECELESFAFKESSITTRSADPVALVKARWRGEGRSKILEWVLVSVVK